MYQSGSSSDLTDWQISTAQHKPTYIFANPMAVFNTLFFGRLMEHNATPVRSKRLVDEEQMLLV